MVLFECLQHRITSRADICFVSISADTSFRHNRITQRRSYAGKLAWNGLKVEEIDRSGNRRTQEKNTNSDSDN